MGTHRSAAGSRGVSKGLVISVVAVLLVVAAVGGWFWLSRHAASENRSAAAECVEGPATLAVTVDPDIAAPVRAAAERYNATKPKVRDHCANVAVTVQPSAAVVAGFTSGSWGPELGPQPALWIADSSRSIEAMRVPGLVEGTPAPVAVSPIVLGVPDQLRQALEKAKVGWSDLPRLQQGSLSEIGVDGWGGLRLAVPTGDNTLAAAAAVGASLSSADPLTDEAARSGQVVSAISRLAADAPQAGDTAAALDALAGAGDPAKAPIHAVAVTEQQLKAKGGVAEYRPAGSAPVADHPAAMLTGSWVDKTQNLLAGVFTDYLRAPDQQKLFADNGFGPAPGTAAAVPSKSVLDQVRSVLANPVLGVQATVLIDTSAAMGTTDGPLTRLGNTLGALQSTMDTMPPDFGLGVWTYSRDLDGTKPYKILAPTAALTQQHRTDVVKSLSGVTPTSSRTDRTYPALEAAYRSAVDEYAAGRTNSVLLVTAGPNDDSDITGDQLISDITAATDPAHPVRIDIIVIGGQGTTSLQTLAQKTGGTYTRVASSDNLTFGTAMNKALTTP
ncbi:VWA domain-containing protein [Nocardia transvalensis]|uniref:VWA domain-containing protein n=1 Tax=Nocardia transvalensis TaxID=37333 RepID=UPI001893ACFE|nr:substrate-binding domain-containing protein [Nocardia transvalensis]MBF6327922.1 substrate-binding domain-containing protein [Nocardia transvalensis]